MKFVALLMGVVVIVAAAPPSSSCNSGGLQRDRRATFSKLDRFANFIENPEYHVLPTARNNVNGNELPSDQVSFDVHVGGPRPEHRTVTPPYPVGPAYNVVHRAKQSAPLKFPEDDYYVGDHPHHFMGGRFSGIDITIPPPRHRRDASIVREHIANGLGFLAYGQNFAHPPLEYQKPNDIEVLPDASHEEELYNLIFNRRG